MKKMNDRGMSLVELVVAFAILAIVTLAISGFLSTSARTYVRVNSEINLQYESQILLSQLQEYLVDANAGVFFDGTTLYVTDYAAGGKYDVYVFRYDSAADELYFGKNTVSPGFSAASLVSGDLMARHVSDFGAALTTSELSINEGGVTTKRTQVEAIRINLKMSIQDRSYETSELTAPRNHPQTATISATTTITDFIALLK